MATSVSADVGGYAVFLAFAEADRPWVEGFLLPELGLGSSEVITSDDFVPGASLAEEAQRAVLESTRTVLVLSRAFLADRWAGFSELLASHLSVAEGAARLIPLLLEPCDVPVRLAIRLMVDCTEPTRWAGEVSRLRRTLRLPDPPPERLSCPYPGMAPFGPDEGATFFGRDREVAELHRLVRRRPFVLVVGASGSGKSSLVAAGLGPCLATEPGWVVRRFRPGAQPVGALASCLGEDPAEPRRAVDAVLDGASLPDTAAGRLLLVVDQLEEVFTQAASAARAAFFDRLDAFRRVEKCVLVAVLRADFYADFMASPLWPLDVDERVEVAPLRGAELAEAIVRPAAAVGVRLDPALLERLRADAADEPGALPLLQEAMVLLWERRQRRLIEISAYRLLGRDGRSGLAVALATRADTALGELDAGQREIARRIMLRLVAFGDGRPDTRRRQLRAELTGTDHDRSRVDGVLRRLIAHRLLTVDRDDDLTPGGARVDLTHETLIAGWPTLQRWIVEGRADETLRRKVEQDAAEWAGHGADRGLLYRGSRLAESLEWSARDREELSAGATAFLAGGRRHRRLVRVGTVLALAGVFGLAAWFAAPPVRKVWWRHRAGELGPTAYLPGGTALVGAPPHLVRVAALDFDVHEVTLRQYRLCVRAGECQAPREEDDDGRFSRGGDPDLPVVAVSAFQAAAYCGWVGRRLPTQNEWERAARGLHGRLYPWGSRDPTPDQVYAIVGGHRPASGPIAVEDPRVAGGRTPEGIWQLIGNVQEWTATEALAPTDTSQPKQLGTWDGRATNTNLAVPGGSWELDAFPAAADQYAVPSHEDADIGIRCVAPANS